MYRSSARLARDSTGSHRGEHNNNKTTSLPLSLALSRTIVDRLDGHWQRLNRHRRARRSARRAQKGRTSAMQLGHRSWLGSSAFQAARVAEIALRWARVWVGLVASGVGLCTSAHASERTSTGQQINIHTSSALSCAAQCIVVQARSPSDGRECDQLSAEGRVAIALGARAANRDEGASAFASRVRFV